MPGKMKSLIIFALIGAAIANPLIIEDDAETRGLFSNIAGAFSGALSNAAPSPMDIGSVAANALLTNIKVLNGGMDFAGMSTLQKAQFAIRLGSGDLIGAMGIVGSAVSDKVKKQFGNPDLLNNLGGAVGANKTQEVANNMAQLATAVVGLVSGGNDVPEGAEATATSAAATALNGTAGGNPAEGLRAAINAVVASMAKENPKIGAVIKKGIESFTAGMSKLSSMAASGYGLFGGASSSAVVPSTESGSTAGSDSGPTTTSGPVTGAAETTVTAAAA